MNETPRRGTKVRRLALSRETVRALGAAELKRVAGGGSDSKCLPTYDCTNDDGCRGTPSNLRTIC